MKDFLRERKWLIGILLIALVLGATFAYLVYVQFDFTYENISEHIDESLSRLEKSLIAGSLIVVFSFTIFINLFSNLIYNVLFPSGNKKIIKQNEEIKEVTRDTNEVTRNANQLTQETNRKLDELIKAKSLDTEKIHLLIVELLAFEKPHEAEEKIIDFYDNSRVSIQERELLRGVLKSIFDKSALLSKEIELLSAAGENDNRNSLVEIRHHFRKGDAKSISNVYYAKKQKDIEDRVKILKEAIKSTEVLFAFKETTELYNELIELEPTTDNIFECSYFFEKHNFIDQAILATRMAIGLFTKMREEDEEQYYFQMPNIVTALSNLSVLFHRKENYNESLSLALEALKNSEIWVELSDRLFKPLIAQAANNVGNAYKHLDEFSQAIEYYEKSNVAFADLTEKDSQYVSGLIMSFTNLASVYVLNNQFDKAQVKYIEVLKIFRNSDDKSKDALFAYSGALSNFATLQRSMNHEKGALENCLEALEIRKSLDKKYPFEYTSYVSVSLNNLGNLYSNLKRYDDSIEVFNEAIEIYRNLNNQGSEVDLQKLAKCLNNVGTVYKKQGKFELALVSYNNALDINKQLIERDKNTYSHDLSMTFNNLAMLHLTQGDFTKANKNMNEALLLSEELSLVNSRNVSLRIKTISNYALMLLGFDQDKLANQYYHKGLTLVRKMAKKNPAGFEIEYASFLVMGVETFKKNKKNLKPALKILKKHPQSGEANRLKEKALANQ